MCRVFYFFIISATVFAGIDSGGGVSTIGKSTNQSTIGGYLATTATNIGSANNSTGFMQVIYVPAILSANNDRDADGIPDDWENLYGLSTDTDDSASDYDNDGMSALMEYLAGTSPIDRQSRLEVHITEVNDKAHVSLNTALGRTYEFLVSQDFETYVSWSTLPGTGDTETLIFDMEGPDVEANFGFNPKEDFFYKVKLQITE